ncbi:pyruvate carboxylase subunit B [Coprothermobacteraceae bacterium]|nr:pyruvate carboxylase subunit B [Coprothermobacteraceae bacterium]
MGIKLHDQTLRDAHQSLLATRLRTEDMLEVAPLMDEVGFFSVEVWGGATFDAAMRYLAEDPWERLQKLKERFKKTPMQMLLRGMNLVAYRNFPDDVVTEFVRLAKKNGVDNFRIFDALNDLRNLEVPIKAVKKYGGHVQGALSYTESPVHTVEYYVEHFKKLAEMGCDSLVIKDMAGIISPQRARDIVAGVKKAGIDLPLELHSHCTSGMTEMAYMEAVHAGVDILDTAMSPFSNGVSQPPTESVVAALQGTPWDTGYDFELLMRIREKLVLVWNKYRHLHEETILRPDPGVLEYKIPGGMMSNMLSQLKSMNALDKLPAILKEVPVVWKEFGYPPLVTPLSQIVGSQAVANVLSGERYKLVQKETKDYLRGMYGKPPAPIDEEVLEKVFGPSWKDEIITVRPADLLEPELEKRREELKSMGLIKKEEDVLTYTIFPDVAVRFFKGEIRPEFTSKDLPLKKKQFEVEVEGNTYKVRLD